MSKIFTKNHYFSFLTFLFLGLGTALGQNIAITQNNTPVTTNFNGWNGTLPTGYSKVGANYVGTSASTTGGLYAVAASGFGYQPSSTSPNNSVTLNGSYINSTGAVITSLKVTYDAFKIVDRASRLPGWSVTVNGAAVSGLTWVYNASSSNTSPNVKTATLTGLNIANNATFTVSFASDRGTGSGSSPMIGLNNVKVESVVTTPPAILNSETFLTDFGDVVVGNTSIVRSLTFDAEALTGDVTVLAPAGFEISEDNINWYTGTDISPVGGMLNDVEIYVRFKPTAVGPYSDVITLMSPGATTKTVLVTGNGIPALSLSVTPASITSLSYPENGGPSPSFQLTGMQSVGLIPSQGDITISPALGNASNYEVSIDGITWGSSVLYPYTSADNNITNPTIFIRIKAGLAAGPVAQETVNVTGGGLSTTFTIGGTINPASTIAVTDTEFGPYCNGTAITFDLPFTNNGGFISPNYYAQLSNIDGTFPDTATNIVGTGTTSPIAVTLPAGTLSGANYRIRVYNDSPLTFSTNDNGHNIVINDAPIMTGITTMAAIVCAGSGATFNLTGLLPSTTFVLNYNINGGTTVTTPSINANATGDASFTIQVTEGNNGQLLTVTSIERTDVTPSCTLALTANNTMTLGVNPLPTVADVEASVVCGDGESTTITLTGLLPNSTSDVDYTINGGTAATATNVTANASGEAAFTLPLSVANNGQELEIVSLTRTDITPNCTKPVTGVSATLIINERPTAVISGDQSICFGTPSSDISVAFTGTAPWNLTYTDGTSTYNAGNITVSPYTFTVNLFGTKTYTITAVEDAHCDAIPSGMTGSATVTVSQFSNGGTISGSTTVCAGSNSGTLTLNNNVGDVVKWQSSPTIDFSSPVDIANTTTSLNYTDLTETTYFRAVVSNGTCASANSAAAVITLNTVPALITQPQTFCNEGLVSDLFPSGTGINWYQDASGGTALSLTDALSTGNYYVSQTISGCESARTLTAVTINNVSAPVTTPQEFCNQGTVADLEPSGTGINWYSNASGGSALPLTSALTAGDYYVSQTINGCESARTLAAITINTPALPQGSPTQEINEGGTLADLNVTGTGLNWYQNISDITAGNILPANTLAVNNTTYYVTQTVNGCTSEPLAVTVTVLLGTPGFNQTSFNYYPNPVQDILHIDSIENIDSIAIYNLVGQQLMTRNNNGNNLHLDISELATGTYLVKIGIGTASKTFKVIKD